MSVLYILVLASLAVAGVFLLAFAWSVRSNQFEDKEGNAMRMLHDNDTIVKNSFKDRYNG